MLSCKSSTNNHEASTVKKQDTLVSKKSVYVNEYGQIEVNFEKDSLVHVVFSNNIEETWDTTFYKVHNSTIFDEATSEGFEVFRIKYSIILISPEKIKATDISSVAFLPMKTKIKNLYERPFYRTDQSVTLYSSIYRSKGDYLIEGIYLPSNAQYKKEDTVFTGHIKKELYPRSYYSTPESPQGMFGDTTQKHYRLVFQMNQ